jgi:hypothetical protein
LCQKVIVLHPQDDVATALTDLTAGETIRLSADGAETELVLREDIAFGHKLALHDLPAGHEILKYGLPIGKALQPIQAGEWVHVHNCRSERFGFHREQYGLNA